MKPILEVQLNWMEMEYSYMDLFLMLKGYDFYD